MSNESERNCERIYGVSPNWIGMVIGLVMFLLFTVLLRGQFSMPNAHELPLFLAPMISCGVAYAVFFDAIVRIRGDVRFLLLNIVCAVLVTFLGVALAKYHNWGAHLFIMGLMFSVFITWDVFVVKNSLAPDAYKIEVETAHKSINLPTLGALLFLTVLLVYMNWSGMFSVPVKIGAHNVSLLDLITTGAVAFHLGVAALAYVCAVTPLGVALIREKGS